MHCDFLRMLSLLCSEILTDPVLEYSKNSRKGMQSGMQNRNAIIPEENIFKQRKTKGEKTKKPYNIYTYILN